MRFEKGICKSNDERLQDLIPDVIRTNQATSTNERLSYLFRRITRIADKEKKTKWRQKTMDDARRLFHCRLRRYVCGIGKSQSAKTQRWSNQSGFFLSLDKNRNRETGKRERERST